MSDCANPAMEPYRRCEIRVVFDDSREHDYMLPINLANRNIHHFEADGDRFVRARVRDWDDQEVV